MDEKVLDILVGICGVEDIRQEKDIDLFESGLLDSLGVIELLVRFEQELHLSIEPTEIERQEISTPNKIIQFVVKRA